MKDSDLVERLLAQNEKLIDALAASSPVEVIRALNPPPVQQAQVALEADWAADAVREEPQDPWGDDSVPLEVLRGPVSTWRSGWVEPPNLQTSDLTEHDVAVAQALIDAEKDTDAAAG